MSRIFTVLAAALLVAAFGLIVLAPYDLPLVKGMSALDPGLLVQLRGAVLRVFGNRVWSSFVTPLLARPVWLVPLALGIVSAGVAATAKVPQAPQRTRRRS